MAAPSVSADINAAGWLDRCAAHVEAARQKAAAVEGAFRGASVKKESETRPGGNRVSVSMFPPTFKVGAFSVSVQRLPADERASQPTGWGMRAESLHGSYHAMFMRKAGVGDAFISFDGWIPQEVQAIAPIFEAAVDLCLADR